MTVIQAIVLGAIQGITEFLPISSSGHLIALPSIFGWEQQSIDFDVMVHLGTLLAICWMMRSDIILAIKKPRLLLAIGLATVPIVLAGLFITDDFLLITRTTTIVAASLIFWGIILWIADLYSDKIKGHIANIEKMSLGKAAIIGVAQVIALIPGTSRSGITMTAGLFAGLDRRAAARFSFLLAIPAVAGAGFMTLIDAMQTGFVTSMPILTIGFVSSAIFGALAIHFLLKLIQRMSYKWFAIYRIVLGLVLLLFFV